MCRSNQNGVRTMERLIHTMLIAILFSGLLASQPLVADKTVAATTESVAEGQMLTQKNSLYPHPDFDPEFEVETI